MRKRVQCEHIHLPVPLTIGVYIDRMSLHTGNMDILHSKTTWVHMVVTINVVAEQ